MNPESWTQNQRDWWTAWRVNLAARTSALVTILGLFSFSFFYMGLRFNPSDLRTLVLPYGLCTAFFGILLLCGTSCGHGTVRAIRKLRKQLEEEGELPAEWWAKRSHSYCAKVGFRAAAWQAGCDADMPRPFRNTWSGRVPFLPENLKKKQR